MNKLLEKLKSCKHYNRSLVLPSDRLQTCFDCGATKRPDETEWIAPLLWK